MLWTRNHLSTLFAITLLLFAGCEPTIDLNSLAIPTATPSTPTAWDLVLLKDQPIGFVTTTVTDESTLLGPASRWNQVISLDISRFGESIRQTIEITSGELHQGGLIDGGWKMSSGDTAQSGRVTPSADRRQLIFAHGAESAEIKRSWRPSQGGFFAVEQSLRSQPMRPGEEREIRGLLVMVNQVGRFHLTAHATEPVELLDQSRTLLRIENDIEFSNGDSMTGSNATKMHATLWTDERGNILKQTIRELGQTIIRTDESTARASSQAPATDLGELATVRLVHQLASPANLHGATSASYRLRNGKSGDTPHIDPLPRFQDANLNSESLAKPLQQMELKTDGSVVLVVSHDLSTTSVPGPSESDRKRALMSSSTIRCESSCIQSLLKEAFPDTNGEEKTLWQKACRLEAFVNRYIERKDFSQLLLNAEQVVEQRRGDCTEHAVLLAALGRAAKIPTRVAIGLVYVPSEDGFVFHMWNESLIDDTWCALDGTLGQGGIGAGHIKIANCELSDGSDWSDFLQITRWMGGVEIELIDAE